MNLADRSLNPQDMIQLMAQEPGLLRRPIVRVGEELVVGMDARRLDELLS